MQKYKPRRNPSCKYDRIWKLVNAHSSKWAEKLVPSNTNTHGDGRQDGGG